MYCKGWTRGNTLGMQNAGARADRLLGQWDVGTQWREGQAATHLKIVKMGA